MAMIGRNKQCPCGSGLKFKRCCLQDNLQEAMAVEISTQKFKERALQSSLRRDKKTPLYFHNVKGVRKLSEIILEFAKPLLDKADGSIKDQKNAICVAIIAWNIALIDNCNIDEELKKLSHALNFEDAQFSEDLSDIIHFLVQRKLNLYSNVKRIILDYDIVETSYGLHLNVASNLMKGDKDVEMFEKEIEQVYGTKKPLHGSVLKSTEA